MTLNGQRQAGSLSVAFALLMIIVVGVLGMGVNLAMIYIRRAELQNVADDAAIAAARALDGTMAGFAQAETDARAVVEANRYNFGTHFSFSANALRFADTPDAADWKATAAVNAGNVASLRFVRVDGGQLDAAASNLNLPFLTPDRDSNFDVATLAVAGPTVSQLAPLAICANDPDTRYGQRSYGAALEPELVEHGFRRGLSYNLLDLNPLGTTPQNFQVDPLDEWDAPVSYDPANPAAVLPFACAGLVPLMKLDRLHVSAGFPAALALALNARFNDHGGGCTATRSSAPDFNIKQYDATSKLWMGVKPDLPGAKPLVSGGTRLTVADPASMPPGTVAADYGYVWAYARAVRYDAAAADHAGAAYSTAAQLKILYPVASGSQVSTGTSGDPSRPYASGNGGYYLAPPAGPGRAPGRRVLHVPLLRCPVSGSVAEVVGIGRFMMMTRASATSLWAEFGGLDSEGSLGYNFAKYR